MSPSARVLFLIGVLAVLLALLAATVLRMDYLGWTAGTIGALSVAAGFVTRALSSEPDENRRVGQRGPSGEFERLVGRPGTRLRARLAQRGQRPRRRSPREEEPSRNP